MNKKILAILVGMLTLVCFHSALAQQAGKVWKIGIFHVGLDHVPPSLETLRQQLKALGYEEGKNLHVRVAKPRKRRGGSRHRSAVRPGSRRSNRGV